jgi:hypothetical protein
VELAPGRYDVLVTLRYADAVRRFERRFDARGEGTTHIRLEREGAAE